MIQIHGKNMKKHWDTRGRTGGITKAGYRVFSTGSRENSTRIYEHIKVMEDYLGRKLFKGESVHHKDGNKLNNNINNLELISRTEHAKMHAISRGLGKDRVGVSPVNKLSERTIGKIHNYLRRGIQGNLIAEKLNVSCSVVSKYKRMGENVCL